MTILLQEHVRGCVATFCRVLNPELSAHVRADSGPLDTEALLACALIVNMSLRCVRSIAAQFNTGRPSNDGINWPQASAAKAALLQHQACTHSTALSLLPPCPFVLWLFPLPYRRASSGCADKHLTCLPGRCARWCAACAACALPTRPPCQLPGAWVGTQQPRQQQQLPKQQWRLALTQAQRAWRSGTPASARRARRWVCYPAAPFWQHGLISLYCCPICLFNCIYITCYVSDK